MLRVRQARRLPVRRRRVPHLRRGPRRGVLGLQQLLGGGERPAPGVERAGGVFPPSRAGGASEAGPADAQPDRGGVLPRPGRGVSAVPCLLLGRRDLRGPEVGLGVGPGPPQFGEKFPPGGRPPSAK